MGRNKKNLHRLFGNPNIAFDWAWSN